MKKHILFLLVLCLIVSAFPMWGSASSASIDKFTDVNITAWYAPAVKYCLDNEYMSGTGTTTFAPSGNVSRAMLVTVLYNMSGETNTAFSEPFEDVPENKWYSVPAAWAYSNGIVNGTSAVTFDPNKSITREQVATMFYNYYCFMKGDPTAPDASRVAGYADWTGVSSYARTAVNWAVEYGLMSGTSSTTLAPKGTCIRAQLAQFIQNYCTAVLSYAPAPSIDWTSSGMYKVGTDIAAGTYYFQATGSVSGYYAITSDASGELESIIANDNVSTFSFLTVNDGQYLEVTRGKIAPANQIGRIDPTSGRYGTGTYRVGIDIPAGEYNVQNDGSRNFAYYAILFDASGKLEAIVDNDNFESNAYITVSEGQYLKLSAAYIAA